MQLARPAFAPHPSAFGRGRLWLTAGPAVSRPEINPDLKLFASTFLVGFLFVSVFLA